MEQKTDRLYPSAHFGKKINHLEQLLGKKINDGNSFNNHINNIKELITYFKDRNNKSKKKYKKYKTLTTILKSFDTFVIIATTSNSITLSLTGRGLTATACGLTIGNKVIDEVIKNKYNKNKKQYEKDQQAIKSFDKLYRKSSKDSYIDKSEYESLCNFFTKNLMKQKMNLFYKNEYKKI